MLSARQRLHGWLRRFGTVASKWPVKRARLRDAAEWSIGLFPDAHDFGFTIVHDADGAYSRRLGPLFEVFDRLGFKITATAFALWADWAANGEVWRSWREAEPEGAFFAPRCVPIADEQEREFYKCLAGAGHEIGMHTPSDTSSRREEVIRAFDLFEEQFGRRPAVYVEHRVNTKLDAQAREGSRPESVYYNTDVLNASGAWVWVDDDMGVPHNRHPEFYDILAANGSPYNHAAAERYGLRKAFLRTGRWQEGDGDGFLSWYSEQHIDALAKNRGLALVYTHLDQRWLEPRTRKMRAAIANRLEYLAAKNGWFVPAGTILDRLVALQELKIRHDRHSVTIVNSGSEKIEGVTVLSDERRSLSRNGRVFAPGSRGDIVIGGIDPGETMSFDIVQPAGSRV